MSTQHVRVLALLKQADAAVSFHAFFPSFIFSAFSSFRGSRLCSRP